MRRLALALLVLSGSSAAAASDNPPDPDVVQLSARVFALIGPEELPNRKNRGFIGNSTVIVGDKGVILVDSGFTHEIGLHLWRAIAKITPKPVTHVINTHPHGDHFLGNNAFPNAEILSSERCREIVGREGKAAVALIEQLTGIRSPKTKPVPATRVYAENTKTETTIEGVRMTLWVPQGSHTPGDMLVYLPEDGVLIAGDVLANGVVPNLREADPHAWLETLAAVQQLEFAAAVPGHGRPLTPADVTAFAARFNELYAAIEAGYKQGLSDSDIRQKLDLSEWRKLKRFDEMGVNINRIYVDVEKRNF